MGLIVFALMLSTTLLSSVLATGDILTSTVQSVAVYNWGNVDETIEGGHGALGTFPLSIYYAVRQYAYSPASGNTIAAVAAGLREDSLLVADESSRQVRSNVTALALFPNNEQGFGGMHDVTSKKVLTIAGLGLNDVYLNLTTAQLLNAHSGDTLYLYSSRWPGHRYQVHVAGIVENAGLVGDNATILAGLDTFVAIEGLNSGKLVETAFGLVSPTTPEPLMINEVFVENRGGGGIDGLGLSAQVAQNLRKILPGEVYITQVKQQGVQASQKAEDIFSRIFSLFALFALAIGLLLIFLIFVLLAAERRAEMGMARAIGVQRRHLVWMYIFEGTIYDLLSSLIGILFGLGGSALLIGILGPILQRFNFPLKFSFQPHSLIVAYCLGVIFTFLSVAIAAWLVSRMTVVEAMRDLPEPGQGALSFVGLGELFKHTGGQLFGLVTMTGRRLRQLRRLVFEHLPNALFELLRTLAAYGILPLLIGLVLIHIGLTITQIVPFSLGVSLAVLGIGLLLNALIVSGMRGVKYMLHPEKREGMEMMQGPQRKNNGLLALLVGGAVVAYWALPFDVLANLGLPRFQGGIEVFFVAGVMMVICTLWILVANARLLAAPFLALCAFVPGLYVLVKLSSAYPLQRRFRTWLNMVMFCLVVFAMTVMAVITNAMQNTYVDINTQTGGYDIQATPYFKTIPNLNTSLQKAGINPAVFSSIGIRDTTAVGVIQPSAPEPRWDAYPAQIVSGGFLQGYGLHLTARAEGFTSDAAIWQALQSHPNYALLDSSAVPYNPRVLAHAGVYDPSAPKASQAGGPATPPGFDAFTAFSLSGVYQGETAFPATPLWVADMDNRNALKVIVIGIVDNSDSAHFGLYLSQSLYEQAGLDLPVDTTNPQDESYYFKVAPGQDEHALSLELGSAFLNNGLETTVLEDAIWSARGPRIFLSDLLLGVVGITLLLGVAALAITGTRAVIERRQQIGMLRALGCSRPLVRSAFLLESFLMGAIGSALGIVLGLVLARNIFAANFFEQYQTGLQFNIPWDQLQIIIAVSLVASLLGALLPAWQAGRVAPAEALRYV